MKGFLSLPGSLLGGATILPPGLLAGTSATGLTGGRYRGISFARCSRTNLLSRSGRQGECSTPLYTFTCLLNLFVLSIFTNTTLRARQLKALQPKTPKPT